MIARQATPAGRTRHCRTCVGVVFTTACWAIAWLSLSGCRPATPPASVEGTLRQNGKPLNHCLVTFMPEPGQKGPHSTGVTDGRGAYRLRFDNQREGATVGPHRVTVQDLSASSGALRRDHGTVDAETKEGRPPPPVIRSRVPRPYLVPEATPLRKEIKPGHQVIDLEIR